MYRPHVLIADGHALLREAFHKLLEAHYEVVGTVADGRALLEVAPRLKPDIILLDIAMPVLNGFDAGARVKKLLPSARLIFLTVIEDHDLIEKALRIGASGYLLKNSVASELFHAIGEALLGRTYITPLMEQSSNRMSILKSHAEKTRATMTSRQREVLQLLAEGHSMKQAALVLGVKPRTVAFHKYRLMEEYGLKTNSDLFQLAIKQKLTFFHREAFDAFASQRQSSGTFPKLISSAI